MAVLLPRHRLHFAFIATTLALAVGLNLIVVTVINALWLRPSPFANADSIVTFPTAMFTSRSLAAIEEAAGDGALAAGQVITDDRSALSLNIHLDTVGRNLETLAVTPEYFRVMGVHVGGRDFIRDDDREGAEPVAIISDRLWSEGFARRLDLLGTVVSAQPVSLRVIGVAAAGFEGGRRGERTDLWIPSGLVPRVVSTDASSSSLPLTILTRLPLGRTAEEFQQRLAARGERPPDGQRGDRHG